MVSLYNASIPMMLKYLGNLKVILTKAEQHCIAKGLNQEEMIKFRLIEDMRSLDYQVQSISNTSKFLATRVFHAKDTYFPDDETTFPQLQFRVDATVAILAALTPETSSSPSPSPSREEEEEEEEEDGDREILMETKSMGTFRFTAYSYVIQYACPNFHFHLGSAYCILRHLGVPLTAFDYLDTQRDLFVKVEEEKKPEETPAS
ncbi:hypothetical protein BDP81DRAFT_463572 [Colletotrichum phormii]|uniref:Uncharacterized protein n=1 Tax=Colletotrichum phormii TaxID=359342 RepID=A0AAJ0EBA1_9PEZI|nr:uncharacterized protein BDP81DRAFT_463572 [Colletotrichum phormii]KAK1633397.1 hypothetical protein BDP81DRAFT_463572 [Colletotrichum phormii]